MWPNSQTLQSLKLFFQFPQVSIDFKNHIFTVQIANLPMVTISVLKCSRCLKVHKCKLPKRPICPWAQNTRCLNIKTTFSHEFKLFPLHRLTIFFTYHCFMSYCHRWIEGNHNWFVGRIFIRSNIPILRFIWRVGNGYWRNPT